MNELIENSLRNISIEFNSELNTNDKFAYIILPHHQNLLLPLT